MEYEYTAEHVLELGKMIDTKISGDTRFSIPGYTRFNCTFFLENTLKTSQLNINDILRIMISNSMCNIFLVAESIRYAFIEKFEDLPLSINKERGLISVICYWRLTIGK